jgi:hypothetical protein
MKTIFLLAFLIFFFKCSNAQITLNRNNFPEGGDTLYMFPLDFQFPNPGPSGPGVTWNFYYLNLPQDYTSLNFYADPDSNLYSSESSNSWGTVHYSWTYRPDTDMYEALGFHTSYYDGDYSSTSTTTYFGGLTQMEFPFTYNSFFTDTANYRYVYNWSSHAGFGHDTIYGLALDTSICDGWGQLQLPFGTYSALRVHLLHTKIDSTANGPQTTIVSEYAWYTQQVKGPILRAIHNIGYTNWSWILYSNYANPMLPGVFENSSSTLQCYYDGEPGMYQLEIKNVVSTNFRMMIYDVGGKIIQDKNMTMSSSSEKFLIDLTSYADGIYFLKIQEDDFVKTFKLHNAH